MAKRIRDLSVMLISQGCATEQLGTGARFGELLLPAGPVNV